MFPFEPSRVVANFARSTGGADSEGSSGEVVTRGGRRPRVDSLDETPEPFDPFEGVSEQSGDESLAEGMLDNRMPHPNRRPRLDPSNAPLEPLENADGTFMLIFYFRCLF